MIRDEEVFKIGRICKAHGVRGEVTMQVDDDVFDRVEADCLILRLDGILVPFFIEEYRFRSDTSALVKFEDVDTLDGARELTNTDVYFLRRLADEADGPYTWTFFVGFDIVDTATGSPVGRIVRVDDTTANVLFELADGRLLPAAEELIARVDSDAKLIYMTLPQGLLDL